ncbi:peptidylprolyl isomerase [Algiphilus sp.]|uniref:peptidylprolyl isomerase n=1 Tax=Algiphilus sp. TaxID=1872431 RepID=UPI001CA6B8B3|nr:peptidylprolyl isomerase [Algiphilus sp.]MBY8965521.1 peptidylprolyl isomerase [Algiphilus acroporae]MCI5063490.1 peptidylprolyl isomerase [Algiphilus sp.]MCI5102996.1 peptidylprolyl isomerase [Algiphilus sp.]
MPLRPFLLALVTFLVASTSHAASPIDRILVVVNDGVILKSELEAAMSDARDQLRQRGVQNIPRAELRDQVLERLVLTRIQTQRAREAGIRVDDRELNDVITGIAQRNGMSQAEFARQLRQDGRDYLEVRESIRDEIITQRLRQRELQARINISEDDVDAYLAQEDDVGDSEVRLSHILISVGDGASPEERQAASDKARDIRQQLQEGADFAALAAAQSDGQQALEGGDLGWRRLAELPPAFARAIAAVAPGELAPIVDATSGYHILRVEERRGSTDRQMVTETRARHILIQPDELMDEDAARERAFSLSERLNEGADFAELAREFSDDPGSKNDGGDLGWQAPGQMVDAFQRQIDALEPGERSRPFRSEFGWHIAEVIDRRERDATEELRRQRARQVIGERRMQEEYEIWLRRLRDEAYIEYRLGEEDA